MARKSGRSRADQPQSNTVLIVFLVFSILLNLALGVFLYLSQDKIDQAAKKETDALAAQKGAEAQRNAATKTFLPLLRSLIGDTVSSTELNEMKENLSKDVSQLPAEAVAWYNGKMWKELFGRGQNDNGLIGPFTEATGKPAVTLMDKIRLLQGEVTRTMDKLKVAEANLKKVTDEYAAWKVRWNPDTYAKDLKSNQDAAELDKQNKLKQKDETITVLNQKITDTTNDIQKTVTEVTKNFAQKNDQYKAQTEEVIKKIAEERKEEKVRLQQDKVTSLNVPKARIVSFEAGSDMALIDLGSAVKLPLGLTFAIHGHDSNGIAISRPKAEGQVVRILSDQMAQIRITRMARADSDRMPMPTADMTADEEKQYWNAYFTSDAREFLRSTKPLYKGDYLFNVIWDPSRRTRIALVGEFDLDGDGTDDIQALINLVRSQGADVDLYLDKANNFKPKGKLDYNTDLVIVGDIPFMTAKGSIGQANPNKTSDVVREGLAVQKEALEKGIRVIQFPRFLSEIGLYAPHAMQNRAGSISAETLPGNNAAPAKDAPPPGDKKEVEPPKASDPTKPGN